MIVLAGLGAGGAERVVSLLCESWVRRGWHVTLVCFDSAPAKPFYPLPEEIDIVRCRRPTFAGRRVAAIVDMVHRPFVLRRQLRSRSPDVVISFLTKINVVTMIANLGSSSVPHLVCERNNPERQDVRPVWRRLQQHLARRSTLVLQTEASRSAFPPSLRSRAIVIPNPVVPLGHRAQRDTRTIVAVGRLVPQKGFDLLLKAFAAIAGAHPDWSLVIWGEGPARDNLEQLRDRLGLAGRVFLPGNSNCHGEWAASGSIFVLSSRYEGFPNVLVEAMSAGLAVVSFDCPWGPGDIIRHEQDGLLIKPEDPACLARGLERLIADPSLRNGLGERAREVTERYALPHVLAHWDEAIDQAAGGRRRGTETADARPTAMRRPPPRQPKSLRP